MVQVNVRVPPELHAAMMKRAEKDGKTVSAVVNAAISNYVKGIK